MDSNESVPSADLSNAITKPNSIQSSTLSSSDSFEKQTSNIVNHDDNDANCILSDNKKKLIKRKLDDLNSDSTNKIKPPADLTYKNLSTQFNNQDDQINSTNTDSDIASDSFQAVTKINDVNDNVCSVSNNNGIEDSTKRDSYGSLLTNDVNVKIEKKSELSNETTKNENQISTNSHDLANVDPINPFISVNDSNYFNECFYPQETLFNGNLPYKSSIFNNNQLSQSIFSPFVVHTDVTTTTFSTFTKTTPTIQGTTFPAYYNNESNQTKKSDSNAVNIEDNLIFTDLRESNHSNKNAEGNFVELEPALTLNETWPSGAADIEMSSLTTQELAYSISDLLVFNQSNLTNLDANASSNANNNNNDIHHESSTTTAANNDDDDTENFRNVSPPFNNSDIENSMIYQFFDPFQSDNSNLSEEPLVIMTKTENSCNFVERKILLGNQAKIGRSIGRTRPSSDNAIFDCKVLSRNHALLWYKDGKFYLKDTCSSNGTFVNNQRLSSANERSLPQVLYSGDCVQFGVEVVEKKNVHSCVIATLRLFHPDGTEARKEYGDSLADSLKEQINNPNMPIQIMPSQLIDIYYHVKESLRRQCLLENQIKTMKEVVQMALDYAKNNLQSSINEDRLLSRIQTLQSQLDIYIIGRNQKNAPQLTVVEMMQKKNLQLINDKENLEMTAKETLEKTLGNKVVLECALEKTRADLQSKIQECDMLKESINTDFKDMKTLLENCDKLKRENEELLGKMKKSVENAQQQTDFVKFSDTLENFSQTDDNTISEAVINTAKALFNADKTLSTNKKEMQNEMLKKVSLENFEQIKNFYEKMDLQMKNVLKFLNDKIDHLSQIEKNVQNLNGHDKCEKIIKYYQNLVAKQSENEIELKNKIENYRNIMDEQAKDNSNLTEQLEQMKKDFSNLRQTDTKEQSVQAIIDNEPKTPIDQPEPTVFNKLDCLHCSTFNGLVKLLKQLECIDENDHLNSNLNQNDETQLNYENDNTLLGFFEKVHDCGEKCKEEQIYELIQKKIDMIVQEKQTVKSINDALNKELETVKNKYSWLSYQNDVSFGFAIFPLVAIFVAIIWAFYKQLSYIVATAGW